MNRLRPQIQNGLQWVRGELDQSLDRARALIESHADHPSDPLPLQQAFVELHQVRGTASMIQCFGLAVATEEMKQTVHELMHGKVADVDTTYSTLLGASVQLSDYVDAIASGADDCVLVLQPLINELRLSSGKNVLTESDLFVSQLRALNLVLPAQVEDPNRMDGAVQIVAQKFLPVYQTSLLHWLKHDAEALSAVGRMGKIAEQLAVNARSTQIHLLWRTCAAVVEALLTRTLEESIELKRLFGAAGQQIKLLAESGEDAAIAALADLPYQLLFFVGRSRGQGPRVSALRRAFVLDTYLPPVSHLEEVRRKIKGPNTTLMARVSQEISTDLSRVKDALDLLQRGGARAVVDMPETQGRLKRVADTLSMLGLPLLHRVVANQVRSLESLVPGEALPADLLIDVATALLRVESSLDDALFRSLRRDPGSEGAAAPELREDIPHARDLKDSQQALLRESLVSLARMKSGVDGYIKSADVSGLAEGARMLDEIAAAMGILQIGRAEVLVGQLARYLKSPAFARVSGTSEGAKAHAETFADAVACVEYFIEARKEGVTDAERMLDDLAQFVEKIDFSEQLVAAETLTAETVAEPVERPAAEPVTEVQEAVDTEIRDIFLEESAEVIQTLNEVLPRWSRDVHDTESLTVLRRGFHTLKGSGRMVGATEIAEFAWSLENMLNRCLNGTIPMGSEAVEVTQKSVALLPQLVESFRSPAGVIPQKMDLLARANAVSNGTLDEAEQPLINVFREDARDRLGEINAWLENPEREGQNVRVPQDIVRAFHTLRGAAATVGLEAPSQLAGAMENALEDLTVLESALPAVAEITAQVALWTHADKVPAAETPEVQQWIARAAALGSDSGHARAPDPNRELAEIFAGEAFDLVQKLEENAASWALSPTSSQAPQALKVTAHTLLGAALMSDCPSLATPSRALVQRMDEALLGAAPDSHFFAKLAEVFEQMYQFLDAYREGRVVHDGSELATLIGGLPWNAAPPTQGATPAVEMEQTVTDSIDMPAVAEGTDDELTQIFLSEARDLLESLDAHSAAWEQNSHDHAPAQEIQRVLHTFKGGARMAGLMGLGDVAHRLESLLEKTLHQPAVPSGWFACLHQVSDGLHGALDGVSRGQWSDTAALLAEMDAYEQSLSHAVSAPAALVEAEPLSPPVAEVVEFDSILVEAELALAEADAPATLPGQASPLSPQSPGVEQESNQDSELAEVFGSEAAELLEQLESALSLWREQPQDSAPIRDIQHALHTLKGGARMAGLNAMGTAAHEMEESVMRMEQGLEPVDAVTLARLQGNLEDLQTMHDLLERHDLEPLQQERFVPRAAAPAAAAAEPAAVREVIQPVQPVLPHAAVPAAAVVQAGGLATSPWDPQLFWKPELEAGLPSALRRETARVAVEQLDGMLNQAGEISIFRSRLEQQVTGLQTQLNEMAQAIQRLREQLRLMDIETEAQISARGLGQSSSEQHRYEAEFDPLEMDRFTRMQELSRSLSESVSDLSNLHVTMDELADESETLLQQQGRINTQVQQGLMGTLMVPFSRQVARLQRVVKQTAQEIGKQAEAVFIGVESELDRNVLERMTAPLEHLLRNAVVHGLETPEARRASGKPEMGKVTVSLWREGTQLLIELRDDGAGLNYKAIREQAIKRGLMPPDAQVEDAALAQFIFEAGFSTAKSLTQAAGRGIGMDVVASEVKQLGGSLELGSEAGKGTRFLVRLPLTLAISQALLTGVGTEQFAIPLPSIEGIARIPRDRLDEFYAEDGPTYAYGGQQYRVHYLGDFVGIARDRDRELEQKSLNAILVRISEGLGKQDRRVAMVVDGLLGNREIVSKSVGPQVSSVTGISGASILADGNVVLLLDIPALLVDRTRRALITQAAGRAGPLAADADVRNLVMVVDDSITIRRVTERLLLKNGYRVTTAKDGLDAMAKLQTEHPVVVLLDIEMPRADGFEVATFIRNSERIASLPIIMITSRSGDKHRERARQIGVNRYLIKPFQEEALLHEITTLLQKAAEGVR